MSVLTVSKEIREKVRAKAEINEERIQEAVKILKEWLELQPHLPKDYGKQIKQLDDVWFLSVCLMAL
jgi:hypothetical protein